MSTEIILKKGVTGVIGIFADGPKRNGKYEIIIAKDGVYGVEYGEFLEAKIAQLENNITTTELVDSIRKITAEIPDAKFIIYRDLVGGKWIRRQTNRTAVKNILLATKQIPVTTIDKIIMDDVEHIDSLTVDMLTVCADALLVAYLDGVDTIETPDCVCTKRPAPDWVLDYFNIKP